MSKQTWASAERNKGPILEVLARVLPKPARLLEIGSGTGQHAVHFACNLPGVEWRPSDPDPENLVSIRDWIRDSGLPNVRMPLALDVRSPDWEVEQVDAIFCSNMIHIAPWECAEGLFRGAGRVLRSGGVLVLYGPYRIGGAHTAPSNERFDADLKGRNPLWGVRDLEAVEELGKDVGLELRERVEMPANNQCLVFERR